VVSVGDLRYIIVAIGGPDETVEDEDVTALKEMLERMCPLITFTELSERTSRKLTIALLQERGVL